MEIEGRVVVVTGAGSGIGRAMAKEFAAAGACVIAGDVDGASAEATIADIERGRARSASADAGTDEGIRALIDVADREYGPVDVYVANAGIIGPTTLGDADGWGRALDVNLLGHVKAAAQLVPDWQARGRGHFVSVASAAGLLTQLGGAAYAVTKHAAVAFAEWLAIAYGDEGIGVSCVCPLGVNTPLFDAVRDMDGAAARLAARSVMDSGPIVDPRWVAQMTVAAVRADAFMVLPHPQVGPMFARKAADPDRWVARMRQYQRSLLDE